MSSNISNYFSGIAAKRLSAVEVERNSSNQHEFNGIGELKSFFGESKIRLEGKFIYVNEKDEIIEDEGYLTWYDARENNPFRTEYRLYYSSNIVTDFAKAGDLLIIGKTQENMVYAFMASEGSTSEMQLLWLFGLHEVSGKFEVKKFDKNSGELNFASKYIISSLGIELQDFEPNYTNIILERYGNGFPSTFEFSNFCRQTLTDVSPLDDPDQALLAYMEREELLFKALEKHLLSEKLARGFGPENESVDEFIKFSLSVHNRRKSRAGHSFENHLAYIFDLHDLRYSKGKKTERNNKPDFLFPGINFYLDNTFDAELLSMLGVKTTAKDRWRQLLAEADRIKIKHMITLEPSISKNQTDEMLAQNLRLVIPRELFATYHKVQIKDFITLGDFIHTIKERQYKLAI